MGTHRKCCCDIEELDCPCPVYPTWCFGWQGYRSYTSGTSITQANGRWTPLWFTSPYYNSRTSLSWQIGLTLYQFNDMKMEGTSVYQKPSPGAGIPGATYCAFNEPARTSVANNPAGSQDFPFRLPPKPTGTPPFGDNDWCIPYNYPAPEWVGVGGRPGNNQNEVTIIWPLINAEQPQDGTDWDFPLQLNQYCCSEFVIGEDCTTGEQDGFRNADKLCLGFEIQGNSALLEEMWSGLSGVGFGTNGVIGSMLGNATSTGRWAKRVYSENGGALKALRFFADPNVWGYNVATSTSGGRGIQGPFRLMKGAAMRPLSTWNNHRAVFTHTNWGKENGYLRNCFCNTSFPEAESCTTQEVSVSFPLIRECESAGSVTAKWPVPLVGYPLGQGCKYAFSFVQLYNEYANPEPVNYPRVWESSGLGESVCYENGACTPIRSIFSCEMGNVVVNPAFKTFQCEVGCRKIFPLGGDSGIFIIADGKITVGWNSEGYVYETCGCSEVLVDCNSCNLYCPPAFESVDPCCNADGTYNQNGEGCDGNGNGSGGPGSGPGFGPGGPGGPGGGGGPGAGTLCGTPTNPCVCCADPGTGDPNIDCFIPPPVCECYAETDPESTFQNLCCVPDGLELPDGSPVTTLGEYHNCLNPDTGEYNFAGASPRCACIALYCGGLDSEGPICGHCPPCVPCCGVVAFATAKYEIYFDIRNDGAGPKLSDMAISNIRVYFGTTELDNTGVEINFIDQPNYTLQNGNFIDYGCDNPPPINGGVGCFITDPSTDSYPYVYCNAPNTNYENQ